MIQLKSWISIHKGSLRFTFTLMDFRAIRPRSFRLASLIFLPDPKSWVQKRVPTKRNKKSSHLYEEVEKHISLNILLIHKNWMVENYYQYGSNMSYISWVSWSNIPAWGHNGLSLQASAFWQDTLNPQDIFLTEIGNEKEPLVWQNVNVFFFSWFSFIIINI